MPNAEERAESALIARAQDGDQDAFRELVEGHSTAVFRLAYRMMGSEENAEDVVQEAFLKAYRNLHRFDGRARFGTWLHRIAANSALDQLRRRQRHPEDQPSQPKDQQANGVDPLAHDPLARLESAEPGPFRLAFSGEIERRLERALNDLTPLERTAFCMRHFEQQSIAEIGKALGSKTSATKQAVFRAVRKLRDDLAPLMETNHAQSA